MGGVRAMFATLNGLAEVGVLAGGWVFRGGTTMRRTTATGRIRPAVPEWCEGPYAHAGVEPSLDELLHEPIVQLIMRADRCDPTHVRHLLKVKQQPLVA